MLALMRIYPHALLCLLAFAGCEASCSPELAPAPAYLASVEPCESAETASPQDDQGPDHDHTHAHDNTDVASEPSDSYCPTRSLGCPCDVLGDCAYSLTCMDGLCGVCVDGNPGCACDAAGKCDLDLWCTSSGICEFID